MLPVDIVPLPKTGACIFAYDEEYYSSSGQLVVLDAEIGRGGGSSFCFVEERTTCRCETATKRKLKQAWRPNLAVAAGGLLPRGGGGRSGTYVHALGTLQCSSSI